MKNFLQSAVFLVSCLFATFVVAQTTPEAPARLFVASTSPEQWANTMALYKEHKVMVNDELVVDELVKIAYGTAQRTNHPSGQLSEEAFKKAWQESNPNLPLGGKVKAEAYQTLAQAKDGGIYLPRLAPTAPVASASAGPVPAPVVAPAVTTAPVSTVSPPDGKQAIAIGALEAQVKSLQAAVAKVGDGQKEAAVLKSQLAALGKKLSALNTAQSKFAQKGDIDKAVKELGELRDQVTTFTSSLDGVKANQDGMSVRLDALEASPFAAWWKQILGTLTALVLLCAGVAFILWKKTNKAQVVAEEAKTLSKAAVNTADSTQSEFGVVKETVARLEEQIEILDPTVPANLELQLQALKEGEEYLAEVMAAEKPIMLRFTRAGNGVKIEGIASQQKTYPVLFENVRKRIKKAAYARDLVGVEDADAFGAQPQSAPMFATR